MVRYLGINLDQKLTFKSHIENVIKKAKLMTFKILYPILKRNNSAPVFTKIQVYRSVIRPIMTYTCPVFNNAANTHLNKLQIHQNKCLRMALNAEFYTRTTQLHHDAKIPTIREFIDKSTSKFYLRAKNHDSPLINTLGNYSKDRLDFRVRHRLPLKI